MPGSQSIGNLAAIISANAQQLVDELNRAQGSIDQVAQKSTGSFDKMTGSLARAGLQVVAGAHLFNLLHREIADVIKNVEDIHGISPETLSSVQEMRHNLSLAGNELKAGLAWGLAQVQDLMTKIGASTSNLVNTLNGLPQGDNTPTKLTPDELERDRDKNFDKKLKAAQHTLKESQLKYYEVGEDKAHTLINLTDAYHQKMGEINRDTMDSIEITKIQTEAQRIQNEIKQKTYDISKEISDLSARDAAVVASRYDIFEDKQVRVRDLMAQRATMAQQEARLMLSLGDVQAGVSDKVIALKKKEIAIDEQITQAMRKADAEWKQVGSSLAGAFESAVFSGKKLDQMLKALLEDVLKIAFRSAITTPLGNFLGVALKSIFGYADGGRPPVGQVSVVGEAGPELFVPDSSGTVIPNDQAFGGGGGGNTYYVDARGADMGVVTRIGQALKALAGPGVVEMRALGAVSDHLRRGGSFA